MTGIAILDSWTNYFSGLFFMNTFRALATEGKRLAPYIFKQNLP